MPMLYVLYDIVSCLSLPLLSPFLLFRCAWRGKARKGIKERFGFYSREKEDTVKGRDCIWVHAVSVGETMAVRPLLKELKSRYPERKIILSTVTETGQAIGEKLAEVDLCIYFPFDFRFAVGRSLSRLNPSLIVVVETEIWPNFLRHARLRSIPVVIANGRISDKSFKGYLRFSRVFRKVLENVSAFCMQTEEDARRITAIGADPSRVHVARNLKYDMPVSSVPDSHKEAVRSKYHLPPKISVITAGSTHQGEEAALLSTFKTLAGEGRELILILAPRHPERADDVARLAGHLGIPCVLRSSLRDHDSTLGSGEILLVDTVGELMALYSISDLVFVGGSLVPLGGHNILEPAALGVPVLFGPHMKNFREIASRVLNCAGGVMVDDVSRLTDVLRGLLDSPSDRAIMGTNGMQLLAENSGSTERHMEVISAFLTGKGAA